MVRNIIGISALYHDSACCLLQDGKLKIAIQEERFTRKKNDSSIPYNAFMFCLNEAGLSITDIDCVAYYEDPVSKLSRQLCSGYDIQREDLRNRIDPSLPEKEIREKLGYKGHIEIIGHHLAHAASSYYFSGFEDSAIMTVDGVGEWATTTYGYGKDGKIDIFEEVNFPNSLGLFYSTITSYLGFKVNSGEYKVMGLAPYGKPLYVDEIRKIIKMKEKGQYELEMEYYDFINGERMYSDKLVELLGQPPRIPETEILQFHMDVARSLQVVLEEVLLEKVNYLHEVTESENLCMAGGVALNCVANRWILNKGPFKNLFVQPSAGDSGGALGAAAVAYCKMTNERPNKAALRHVYLGPEYSYDLIKKMLDATSLKFDDYYKRTDELLSYTAELLANGKVVGWYQGKMEFGPRALGNRSILADPRNEIMRDRINAMVKKREAFRPFAPAVLEEKAWEHFDLDGPSPFMLRTCDVISPFDLPAITHVDNSARVQTVNDESNLLFAGLIRKFDELTGCPILLNTSFNVRSEPIVESPVDALICFITTEIDNLVIGDFIIERSKNSLEMLNKILDNMRVLEKGSKKNLYTFI